MKNINVKVVVSMLMVGVVSLTACNSEPKKRNTNSQVVESVGILSNQDQTNENQSGEVISQYLSLKDGLVDDNAEATTRASKKLLTALDSFSFDQYKGDDKIELTKIVEISKDLVKQISTSDMATQRAHFLDLSNNLIEFVAITGAPWQLYQQYCPMYDNNKGGVWLSAQKEIKNPYFGASMLNCGIVQKEIRS